MKSKTLQRRLLADCAAVNTEQAGYLTPPHLRKKKGDGDEEVAADGGAKEDSDAGVVTSDKGDGQEDGKKTKVFGTDEKKTIQEKVTQIDLKKPMHGPSKEFAPQQSMKDATLNTILQINPQMLEIDDKIKQ